MISLDGEPLEQWTIKETAKQMAVVTQFNQLQFDCTVEEIVLLGRTPHLSFLQKERERDYALVQDALVKVDMLEKKTRLYSSLSGGEVGSSSQQDDFFNCTIKLQLVKLGHNCHLLGCFFERPLFQRLSI